MKQNFITVRLFDRELTIKTEEPPEKIEKIVNFVNEYLEHIKKQKLFRDRVSINLLALLNIALEYEEMKEKYQNINGRVAYLVRLIDNFLEKDTCGVRD